MVAFCVVLWRLSSTRAVGVCRGCVLCLRERLPSTRAALGDASRAWRGARAAAARGGSALLFRRRARQNARTSKRRRRRLQCRGRGAGAWRFDFCRREGTASRLGGSDCVRLLAPARALDFGHGAARARSACYVVAWGLSWLSATSYCTSMAVFEAMRRSKSHFALGRRRGHSSRGVKLPATDESQKP